MKELLFSSKFSRVTSKSKATSKILREFYFKILVKGNLRDVFCARGALFPRCLIKFQFDIAPVCVDNRILVPNPHLFLFQGEV